MESLGLLNIIKIKTRIQDIPYDIDDGIYAECFVHLTQSEWNHVYDQLEDNMRVK